MSAVRIKYFGYLTNRPEFKEKIIEVSRRARIRARILDVVELSSDTDPYSIVYSISRLSAKSW